RDFVVAERHAHEVHVPVEELKVRSVRHDILVQQNPARRLDDVPFQLVAGDEGRERGRRLSGWSPNQQRQKDEDDCSGSRVGHAGNSTALSSRSSYAEASGRSLNGWLRRAEDVTRQNLSISSSVRFRVSGTR